MKIGNKLKELRIQKGLTQEELADRAELSKGFISQLERDLTSPSIATLVDILQVLGLSLIHICNKAAPLLFQPCCLCSSHWPAPQSAPLHSSPEAVH